MKLNLQKYLEVSTIHGLTYTTKRFHLVERIFWIISLIFSIICTSILIIKLALNIQSFPVIVYVADEAISVSKIYFPAITMCPDVQEYVGNFFRKGNSKYGYYYERHTMLMYKLEDEEFWNEEYADEVKTGDLQYLKNLTDQIRFRLGNFSYWNILEQLEKGDIKTHDLGMKILKRLQVIDLIKKRGTFSKLNYSVPTEDFLDIFNHFIKDFRFALTLWWTSEHTPYISEVITPYGLCFSFNIALSHDLVELNSTSNDFHYQLFHSSPFRRRWQDLPPEIPRHDVTTYTSELTIRYDVSWQFYKLNEHMLNDFSGFYFMMHDPYELPTQFSRRFKCISGHFDDFLIEPQKISIDDSIAAYEPVDRNCYLEDERKLKFFKVYTKINCETECLSDFMLARCGCVEFFMIRNSTTRICSASEKSCYDSSQADFLEVKSSCGCLERCNYVKYDIEVSSGNYINQLNGKFQAIHSIIKYKENHMKEFIRKRHFDALEFLSFVGGLLGLFAGFSATSFVELVYWFTVRVFVGKCKSTIQPSDESAVNENQKWKLKNFFSSYFEESSIHGLGFIFGFTRLDRIIWSVFSLIVLTFSIDLILNAREKVPDSRVTVFDDGLRFNEEIPFPAITFVPEFNIPSDIVFGEIDQEATIVKKLENLDTWVEQERYLRKIEKLLFCLDEFFFETRDFFMDYSPSHVGFLRENSRAEWFRKQFSSFNGRFQPEFSEIRTSRGMGFTFNLMDVVDLIDFRYTSSVHYYIRNVTTDSNAFNLKEKYPVSISTTDRPHLTLKLTRETPENEIQYLDPAILVHDIDYIPTFTARKEFKYFEYGMELNVEISPEIVRTDESLRQLSPEDRDCYFEGEKRLKFFKKYSQKNCQIECLANITFQECRCNDMNQPFAREEYICPKISKYDPTKCPLKMIAAVRETDLDLYLDDCSCLPMCNSVTYKAKYTSEFETGSGIFNETTLNVRMNMDEIVLFRRYQQFTRSDVVSYVGGLLGLFAGISMLSIVEFVYFFTIRLAVDMWRLMRRRGRGQ